MSRKTSIPYFRVGQRIVCVDATLNRLSAAKLLTRGKIYRIRAIDLGHWKLPSWGVHLDGIWLLYPGMDIEWAFNPKRFRPVDKRRTDIEIFRRMLAGVPGAGRE